MDEETLKEMQGEELEVIQAIYMDDYKRETSSETTTTTTTTRETTTSHGPPLITLHLLPLQSVVGKDVHAKVDLKVQFTTRYPYDTPVLYLENEKGGLSCCLWSGAVEWVFAYKSRDAH